MSTQDTPDHTPAELSLREQTLKILDWFMEDHLDPNEMDSGSKEMLFKDRKVASNMFLKLIESHTSQVCQQKEREARLDDATDLRNDMPSKLIGRFSGDHCDMCRTVLLKDEECDCEASVNWNLAITEMEVKFEDHLAALQLPQPGKDDKEAE